MKERKLTPLMICHLAAMSLLLILNIVSAVLLLFYTKNPAIQDVIKEHKTTMLITVGLNAANIMAIGFGIAYILSGYRKKAATFYVSFMLYTAAANVFYALAAASYQGFGISFVLIVIKIMVLLALTFKKDLGKRNTWILFAVLVAVDLAVGPLIHTDSSVIASRLALTFTRLLIDATIGLAIRGKYADKDSRGTI